jgi:hypothetical protein
MIDIGVIFLDVPPLRCRCIIISASMALARDPFVEAAYVIL